MRRMATIISTALVLTALAVGPVSAKSFGRLYAEGDTYRTFATPARVDAGTGTDPIFTFENSTNADQLSVARYAPGKGSHGGRWAVYHATWTSAADSGNLVTDYETLAWYESQGRLDVVRDEAADFRCPLLPNG